MASDQDSADQGFPARYTGVFAAISVVLIGGGIALWLPDSGGSSTARSDLGLSLLGGGMALVAGYVVSRAVFVAQARLDTELRRANERRERDSLRMALSMTENMAGADLRNADLGDMILRTKNLTGANLRRVNLEGATIDAVALGNACLAGANLRSATIGVPGLQVGMIRADLSDADLSCTTVIADLRSANLQRANLCGADLGRVLMVHPHPEQVDAEAIEREAADLREAIYNDGTIWPERFDPFLAGAVHLDAVSVRGFAKGLHS